jgi:hypothetical protein
MTPEIANAQIKSTMLGIEDHGIMTFFVFLEWGGGMGCGMGGYALDQPNGRGLPRIGSGPSYQAIRNILEILKLEKWEQLPGTFCRIEYNGLGRGIDKIGHIIEDRWFDLKEHMKAVKDESP